MKMDKSNKGNTITIKINRKDLPTKEQDDKPVQSKIREKSESHLSESGEQESAAAKEPIEEGETFEWILPAKKDATESKQSKNGSIEKIEESKSKSKLPPFLNKVNKSEKPRKGMIYPHLSCHFFCRISRDNLWINDA